jgi:Ran-binding protein 3
MNDTPNGATRSGDQSASGSDSERGRLRRKRSHEEYEDEAEADKQPEKKTERHVRKRSRDITKDLESGALAKTAPGTITSITENDADEEMTSPNRNATTTDKASGTKTSPKNKRTRDQAEKDATEPSETASTNGKPADKSGDERDTKRLRDKEGGEPVTEAAESKTKVYEL